MFPSEWYPESGEKTGERKRSMLNGSGKIQITYMHTEKKPQCYNKQANSMSNFDQSGLNLRISIKIHYAL